MESILLHGFKSLDCVDSEHLPFRKTIEGGMELKSSLFCVCVCVFDWFEIGWLNNQNCWWNGAKNLGGMLLKIELNGIKLVGGIETKFGWNGVWLGGGMKSKSRWNGTN